MSAAPSETAAAPCAARPPLRRSPERVLAGVCAGVGDHLGVRALHVRIAALALVPVGGAGLLAYLVLWALLARQAEDTAPQAFSPQAASSQAGSTSTSPPSPARGARALSTEGDHRRGRYLLIALVPLAGVFGINIIARGVSTGFAWGIAAILALLGAGLAWSQIGRADGGKDGDKIQWFAVGAGWLLACLALLAALARGRSLGDLAWALSAGVVILLGTALVLLPVALRMWSELGAQRAARAREAERADIAAHLHDSVLQTLALIRARNRDPDAVTQLARAQERELRQWLYTEPRTQEGSMATQLTELAESIEDAWSHPVEVVTVSDALPSVNGSGAALIAATREALTNAVRHSGAEVRLFAEFTASTWEVFVRDRGTGFDLERIPADRRGVRDSILARMERHGGSARIRTAPGDGTEVHLTMPAPAAASHDGAHHGGAHHGGQGER